MKSANSAGKQTRWRQTLRRMLEQAVRCGWCSCGCLLARCAQHRPFNIRPEVLAAHGAVCGPLNCRAVLCWNVPAQRPIANRLYGPSDGPCQSSLAAGNFNCSCKCVHGPMIHTWGMKSQHVG